jgi:predicted transposase YdaD
VLLGLRTEPASVARLFEGAVAMEESSTYQVILREGMARGMAQGVAQGLLEGRQVGALEELRRILLLQGENRFGEPAGSKVREALAKITKIGRLEQLSIRLLTVDSWSELLKKPRRGAPRRRPS